MRALASVGLPLFCSSSFHLPASLGSTLVTRFLATTDALTPVGRFFGPGGHERRVPPTGLPAYFAYTSCHSVSNHPTVMSRPFFRSLFPSARVHCPAGLLRQQRRGSSHYGKHGLQDGLRSAVAGSSHRLAESSSRCSSTMILCYGLAVHLRQLSTPCCHDAVAFGYRPVILRPDGDFHPAM